MKEPLQGSGGSQLVQLIKQFGYNDSFIFEFATIVQTSPPQIKLEDVGLTLEKDHLLFLNSYSQTMQVGDRVMVVQMNKGQTYLILDKVVAF
jgi:hypothetical protein